MKLNFKTAEQVEKESKEAEEKRIKEMRRKAFQNEADPLFFKWQRGAATEQEWKSKVDEIRRRDLDHK